MLHRTRALEALANRSDDFDRVEHARDTALRWYREALNAAEAAGHARLMEQLEGVETPGALATVEFDRGLILPFGSRWENAQDARSWAMGILNGVTTVGVDGSQLIPSKEYGVPVGLIQVAWFENPHDTSGAYVKDAVVEVLAGPQLTNHGEMRTLEDRLFHGEPVNQRRFARETEKVAEYLQTLGTDPTPLVLFDGSLVVSFASQMRAESRKAYIIPIVRALAASIDHRVPLAGFIDTSYARDLIRLLESLSPDAPEAGPETLLFDAALLDSRMDLFDRTCVFVCARGDVLDDYVDPDTERSLSDEVCFAYMRCNAGRPPARIEFPRWILDAGLVDRVMDIIRAEIIVGAGYPYPLEAADAAAVLTTQDRMSFYRIFQEFAQEQGLGLAATAKMSSKSRRR